jgi:uncharacterized protein YecA (UPF0149 family)
LIQDIRKTYEQGLVDDTFMGLDEVEEDLARDRETVMAEWKEADHGLIDDVVADMSGWACFEDESAENGHDFDDDDQEFAEEYEQDEPFLRPDPKIGRNAPCPCGSGKKYKKCCLMVKGI